MLKILQAMQKEIQELKSQQPEISSDPSERKQRQKKENRYFQVLLDAWSVGPY